MGQLTCISWNIRGVNSPIKRKKMLTYLKRQKVDIAFIQESHLTDTEHLKLRRDWVGNVFYSSYSSKARGVALLINKHLNFKLNSVEKDKNGRFLLVDLFFNNLIMKLATIGGQCVVGGDFNLVLNPHLDRSSPKTTSLSKAATALNQGMKDLGIIDVWRNLYPNQKDFSCPQGKKNRETLTKLERDIKKLEQDKTILQNNKTPRPDGFPVEYYTAFSKKLLTPLTNMIKEALENKKLPASLEIATITLLPKPGKDKQKCDSYRPLSLLNADYKILSKLIALRLENVIPKTIHADQTGFVKNRHGADNVRRLLHILNTAQKNQNPMLILSMDANKAFDRIEQRFLFRTLEAMGFGEKFTQYVKTLFNAPKANILTNDVLSNTFSLSRGCRQGCPSSPLLFAIAIEPLAIAIRSDISIAGIKFGTSEHKLSLYADDLLLYISDPYTSVPPLLKCLKDYSAVSGYKLNYTKSEILPLNIQDNNIRALTDPLKWCNSGFKYLGIQIGKSDGHIFKQNYIKLLEQTKLNLQKWMDLPLSLIGRINTIKMKILPKLRSKDSIKSTCSSLFGD
uniref:Reverse transcriptase domain-containing protein n=1 Tax=Seriola dumerili TaxID=41447 RepID=A0A3B4T4G4_SERDU